MSNPIPSSAGTARDSVSSGAGNPSHPTAEWTLQQFRDALPGDHAYRCVIHDRDRIFAEEVDRGLRILGVWGSANASASPEGELGMRATGRPPPSRMSRLLAAIQRTPSANNDSGLEQA